MSKKQTVLSPTSSGSPEKYTEHMAHEQGTVKSSSRRSFLGNAASAVAAATVASTSTAVASSLEVQPSSKAMGRPTVPQGYGMPSQYESHVTRNRTDVFVNKQTSPTGA